jgi:Icc protein
LNTKSAGESSFENGQKGNGVMPVETNASVSWAHFGDLHVTGEQELNHRDFLALIEQVNVTLAARIDFAVLPGDNAEDGTPEQLHLIRRALDRLVVPLHVLPGDHDFKPRRLDDFHKILAAEPLPKAVTVGEHRCVFLDVVSAGRGGPDFRLGERQMTWLRHELASARQRGERRLVFMHCYPADLKEAHELVALFHREHVAFVDTGHTHYNELVNDGATIYAATRSTGQIEEGPVGFSIGVSEGDVVSWKFKALLSPWPFVMVTSPSDHRLITNPASPTHLIRGAFVVSARIWGGHDAVSPSCRIDGGPALAMTPAPDDQTIWRCIAPALDDGLHRIAVSASAAEADGEDAITVLVSRSGRYDAPERIADGGDADTVGPWPEKGILGTQLGPNKNGRKW